MKFAWELYVTPKIEDNLKNEDYLKKEDNNLKNENVLKNVNDLKESGVPFQINSTCDHRDFVRSINGCPSNT